MSALNDEKLIFKPDINKTFNERIKGFNDCETLFFDALIGLHIDEKDSNKTQMVFRLQMCTHLLSKTINIQKKL